MKPFKNKSKKATALCTGLALLLTATLSIGTTLAYLTAKTDAVTSSFTLGEITYTLTLNANKPKEATGVPSMPTEPAPKENVQSLRVDFTLDKLPTLDGYTFVGWCTDEGCKTNYPEYDVNANPSTVTIPFGIDCDQDPATDKVSVKLFANWKKSDEKATNDIVYEETTAPAISLDISGIGVDNWYPTDTKVQTPVAGQPYSLTFEPSEGHRMADAITVTIDGTENVIPTDGSHGWFANNVLTIPAASLTEETKTVAITAAEVSGDGNANTATCPECGQQEGHSADCSVNKIKVTQNLTNLSANSTKKTTVRGEDYTLTLTPDEGYKLPETISVTIDGEAYEVYTDGEEHREIPKDEDGNEHPEWLDPMPTFDPATNTLTIQASLLGEDVQSVAVTAAADSICTCNSEDGTHTKGCPLYTAPADATETTEGKEVTQPTESTKTTEPTIGTEPTKITEPTNETESTNATEPTETEQEVTE